MRSCGCNNGIVDWADDKDRQDFWCGQCSAHDDLPWPHKRVMCLCGHECQLAGEEEGDFVFQCKACGEPLPAYGDVPNTQVEWVAWNKNRRAAEAKKQPAAPARDAVSSRRGSTMKLFSRYDSKHELRELYAFAEKIMEYGEESLDECIDEVFYNSKSSICDIRIREGFSNDDRIPTIVYLGKLTLTQFAIVNGKNEYEGEIHHSHMEDERLRHEEESCEEIQKAILAERERCAGIAEIYCCEGIDYEVSDFCDPQAYVAFAISQAIRSPENAELGLGHPTEEQSNRVESFRAKIENAIADRRAHNKLQEQQVARDAAYAAELEAQQAAAPKHKARAAVELNVALETLIEKVSDGTQGTANGE